MKITKTLLRKIIKEEVQLQQNPLDEAKKLVRLLIDAADDMEASPSHIPLSDGAKYVRDSANSLLSHLMAMEK